jgi:hypothetical protein
MQWGLTNRTGGTLLLAVPTPFSTRARLGCILDQLRFQSVHSRVDLIFYFSQRRFRVISSPFFDIGEDFFAQFSPVVFACLVHLPPPVVDGRIVSLFLFAVYPLCKKVTGTPFYISRWKGLFSR